MPKVGVNLDKQEIVRKTIMDSGGIAKSSSLHAAGLSNAEIAAMCQKGLIERIKRGFYQLPDEDNITEEKLLHELLPQGIICIESALFHYGYSDFAPREWSIALPRVLSRTAKRMQAVPIKPYFMDKESMILGCTTEKFNNVELSVFDRERTICDCFKFRTKLDNELFNKALNAYVADDKKNLANLSKYAKEMRIYSKLMNVMEVLLNG